MRLTPRLKKVIVCGFVQDGLTVNRLAALYGVKTDRIENILRQALLSSRQWPGLPEVKAAEPEPAQMLEPSLAALYGVKTDRGDPAAADPTAPSGAGE